MASPRRLLAFAFAVWANWNWLLPAAAAPVRVQSYPNYDDPIAVEPPLPHPRSDTCSIVDVVVNASLRDYGQVVLAPYEPPATCPGPWDQVVLLFSGGVAGVQFDRFGAVWLRGTELLRLTTPEPSPQGITWRVEKDVTDYAELFGSAGEVTLQIPTIVDATYTGVLHINISFAFYPQKAGKGAALPRRSVMPLRNVSGRGDPLGNLSTTRVGQANMVSLPKDVVEARLDLYASGHACEEFWYGNYYLPDATLPSGACGGGAYRELHVYIDGKLAGVQYPFPVVYTGGYNPLLWRPLTGILSFDIPAYKFDLTPFLAWLTDGAQHNVTVAAFGSWQGNWVLDGVMLLTHDLNQDEIVGGSVNITEDRPPEVQQKLVNETTDMQLQTMRGTRKHHVSGRLNMKSGRTLDSQVSTHLDSWSRNTFIGSGEQAINGRWHSWILNVRNGLRTTTVSDYPMQVWSVYATDDDSLQINASIEYSRIVLVSFQDRSNAGANTPTYSIMRRDRIGSAATYNRSLTNRSIINIQEGEAEERAEVLSGTSKKEARKAFGGTTLLCYARAVKAYEGSIVSSEVEKEGCTWPNGVYVCGSDLCGRYIANGTGDSSSRVRPRGGVPLDFHHKARSSAVAPREEALLPFRLPRGSPPDLELGQPRLLRDEYAGGYPNVLV